MLLLPSTMRETAHQPMLGRVQGGEWRGTPSLVAMLVLVLGPQYFDPAKNEQGRNQRSREHERKILGILEIGVGGW